MSKMRTPRNRSALTVSVTPCVPQSTRPLRLLDRHEQQIAVDRQVALPAGADETSTASGCSGFEMSQICSPLKLPWNDVVPAEREVRVDEFVFARGRRVEEAGRPRLVGDELEVLDRFPCVVEPGLRPTLGSLVRGASAA